VTLDYWIGITSCDCGSEQPIGGCLRCDLVAFKQLLDETTRALEDAREFILDSSDRGDAEADPTHIAASRRISDVLERIQEA